jgi:hypothetical protein
MSMRRVGLASLCATLTCACALGTQRFGREIDAAEIASLEVGVSTKADVLRLFGPPTTHSRLPVVPAPDADAPGTVAREEPDSDVFVYEYREDRENFFTVILFTRFRREVLADRLMVFFDGADVVRYVAFAQQTDPGADE